MALSLLVLSTEQLSVLLVFFGYKLNNTRIEKALIVSFVYMQYTCLYSLRHMMCIPLKFNIHVAQLTEHFFGENLYILCSRRTCASFSRSCANLIHSQKSRV